MVVKRPELTETVAQHLETVKDEHDYPNTSEAIRHLLREAGYTDE